MSDIENPQDQFYGSSSRHTAEGEMMFEILYSHIALSSRIRAVAQKLDLVNAWGGGSFDILRMLVISGPQTVPKLAKMRTVARQYMQKLVNDLESQGLVTFVENPKHKKSKLVQITYKGRQLTQRQTEDLRSLSDILAAGLSPQDLQATQAICHELGMRLDRLLEDSDI